VKLSRIIPHSIGGLLWQLSESDSQTVSPRSRLGMPAPTGSILRDIKASGPAGKPEKSGQDILDPGLLHRAAQECLERVSLRSAHTQTAAARLRIAGRSGITCFAAGEKDLKIDAS